METNQNQNEGQQQFKYAQPQNNNFMQSATARVFMVGLLTPTAGICKGTYTRSQRAAKWHGK